MANYNIFMAMVERIGHDKRGNPTFNVLSHCLMLFSQGTD